MAEQIFASLCLITCLHYSVPCYIICNLYCTYSMYIDINCRNTILPSTILHILRTSTIDVIGHATKETMSITFEIRTSPGRQVITRRAHIVHTGWPIRTSESRDRTWTGMQTVRGGVLHYFREERGEKEKDMHRAQTIARGILTVYMCLFVYVHTHTHTHIFPYSTVAERERSTRW